jgi:hypothetical protein
VKILLHIGMGKAGSGALQAGLYAMRRQLTHVGILYPETGRGRKMHELLIHGCIPDSRLPRWLRQAYSGDSDAIGRDVEAWLSTLGSKIDRIRPHTLVLSDEALFRVIDPAGFTRLNARLRRFAHVVDVVAYVRKPSEHYLAAVQQTLKASHDITGPRPRMCRSILEGYSSHLADRLHVVKYDRSAWPDGDIVRHFLEAFAPEALSLRIDVPHEINNSLSAEAMALLGQYRSRIWPDDNNRFTPDTNRLLGALMAADVDVGYRPPRLHDTIRRAIDQGSTDLLWLRDEHGVVFDDIDYHDIRPVRRKMPAARGIEDICPIDGRRLAELTVHVLWHLARDRPPAVPRILASPVRGLTRWVANLSQRRGATEPGKVWVKAFSRTSTGREEGPVSPRREGAHERHAREPST